MMKNDPGSRDERAWSLSLELSSRIRSLFLLLKLDQGCSFSFLLINVCKMLHNHPVEEGIAYTTIYDVSAALAAFSIAQTTGGVRLGMLCKRDCVGVRGENDVCCLGLLKLREKTNTLMMCEL